MLRCVSCGGVCQNACEGLCGHIMCEPCAQYVCRTTGVCPACQQPLQAEEIAPIRASRRQINELVFMCKYGVYGCGESGKVEGLSQHEAQCEHGERVCDGCGRCVKHSEWEHHVGVCEAVQLDCPHQCGVRLCRGDMADHALQCEYGVVVCDLPGCDHHAQRRYMAHHQADIAAHLRLISHSLQQTQLIQQLQQQTNQQLQQTIQQQQQTSQKQQQTIQQLQLIIQQQQQTIQQLQQTIQQQAADVVGIQARHQHLQQQVEQLQQQLADQQQQLQQLQQQQDLPLQKPEEKQEKQEEKRNVSSIGSVVRYLPVFEQRSTCYGVAVSGGRLYLPNFDHHVVDVVDATSGERVTRYGTFQQPGKAVVGQPPQFHNPFGVAVDETRGRVYVADHSNHCVVAVRLSDGSVEVVWGSKGAGQQQFNHPLGLAYCPATDLLYVAEYSNHCVKVLRVSDGQCVQVLGLGRGSSSNQMYQPYGVAVDSDHIYIADTYNRRVLVYAKSSGTFLFQMGQGEGSGNTQFSNPYSVSVDSEAGVVYVADTGNCRVCVYRSGDGSYVRHFQVQINNTQAAPYGVMWDVATGVLYVTTLASTIFVYPC